MFLNVLLSGVMKFQWLELPAPPGQHQPSYVSCCCSVRPPLVLPPACPVLGREGGGEGGREVTGGVSPPRGYDIVMLDWGGKWEGLGWTRVMAWLNCYCGLIL